MDSPVITRGNNGSELSRAKTVLELTGLLLLSVGLCCAEDAERSRATIQLSDVRGLSTPLLTGPERQCCAVLKVKELRWGYQRKGFYRIGVLPMLVADGVTIQVLRPDRALDAFAQLQRRLGRAAGSGAVELRDFVVERADEGPPILKAGRADIQQDGSWKLCDGVTVREGTNSIHAARATLHVAGPLAGTVGFRPKQEKTLVALFAPAQASHGAKPYSLPP